MVVIWRRGDLGQWRSAVRYHRRLDPLAKPNRIIPQPTIAIGPKSHPDGERRLYLRLLPEEPEERLPKREYR